MLSEKFIKQYMRKAKSIADDNKICYSRQLGAVIIKVYDDGTSRGVSSGYNGPPKKTPHCDTDEYLREVFWPQLTYEEKCTAVRNVNLKVEFLEGEEALDREAGCAFAKSVAGCKTCPRRFVNATTGKRLELCTCQHAERNAIYNAAEDTYGCWMFCWCGVPCSDCTGAIINAGIKVVYCLDDNTGAHNGGKDYSYSSRWQFEKAKVNLVCKSKEYYLEGEGK